MNLALPEKYHVLDRFSGAACDHAQIHKILYLGNIIIYFIVFTASMLHQKLLIKILKK